MAIEAPQQTAPMENLATVYERDYQELTALNEKYKSQNMEYKDLNDD